MAAELMKARDVRDVMTKAVKLGQRGRIDGAAITRGLADYVVRSRFEDIPAEVRHEGVRSLVNFIGCTVAGSRHETVEAALAALKDLGASGEAVVLGRSERLDAMNATLVNGISSAVLDFDATQFKRTNIHPSGPVLPPLLAFMTSRSVSGVNSCTPISSPWKSPAVSPMESSARKTRDGMSPAQPVVLAPPPGSDACSG